MTAELSLGEVPGSEGCYLEYSMQSSKGCLRLGDALIIIIIIIITTLSSS